MARPPKNIHAQGIYEKHGVFWLRYTFNGKQVRQSLGTKDYVEAIELGKQKRKLAEKKEVAEAWEISVEKYIQRKLKDKEFTKSTAETAGYALQAFKKFSGVIKPTDATQEMVESFYKTTRIQNESTARNYTMRSSIFLRDCGVAIKSVKFKGDVEFRKDVVPVTAIEQLVGATGHFPELKHKSWELCFILNCGFFAGMRKDEIVNARPDWFEFNLDQSKIKIPAIDPETGWRPKNKRSREIPLIPRFAEFLQHRQKEWDGKEYMISPASKGKRYRYDFRRPYERFMYLIQMDVNPHQMRHTFVTHLVQSGVAFATVSSIVGTRVATIEKHYWHYVTSAEDISQALSSVKTK